MRPIQTEVGKIGGRRKKEGRQDENPRVGHHGKGVGAVIWPLDSCPSLSPHLASPLPLSLSTSISPSLSRIRAFSSLLLGTIFWGVLKPFYYSYSVIELGLPISFLSSPRACCSWLGKTLLRGFDNIGIAVVKSEPGYKRVHQRDKSTNDRWYSPKPYAFGYLDTFNWVEWVTLIWVHNEMWMNSLNMAYV